MSRRIPAPDPEAAPTSPPPRADPDDLDDLDDLDNLDDDDDVDDFDPALLDPDAWPDDEEDPEATVPEARDLDVLPDLTADPDDDDGTSWDDIETSLSDLVDDGLDTEESLPILPLATEAEVDGRPLPARPVPADPRSRLIEPGATAQERAVVLRVAGIILQTTVVVEDGPEPMIRLGLDVLSGRFLLRP